MIRTIKALGLAAAAVLAMSAVVASSAQAQTFTASSYPATGTGVQSETHVFTVQGQKVECTEAHFEGTLKSVAEDPVNGGPSHTITVTPKYNGCTAFGIANAKVEMNGCTYDFTIADTSTVPATTNSVHVKCPANASITVNAPATNSLCVVHIPEQTPTGNTVHYSNINETTKDGTTHHGVHVTSTVTGIHSNVTDIGGFFCPLSTASTDTTGSYTGSVVFEGTEGKTVDIG